MLDIEYVSINNLDTYNYHYDNYDLVQWSTDMANRTDTPLVLSVSYGQAEFKYDNATILSASTEFLKLGLQGISIIVASGDDGPYPRDICDKYSPAFPASSPWVTAVGATFYNATTNLEVGTEFSGGGFSNIFKRPFYQDELVP